MQVTPLPIASDGASGPASGEFGFSTASDRQDLTFDPTEPENEAERQIERLASLYRAFEARALSGDPIAANLCLKVIDRYLRILGLDKPPVQASAELSMTWADIAASASSETPVEGAGSEGRSNGR